MYLASDFLITCSVVPMIFPISRFVSPCQIKSAIWFSRLVDLAASLIHFLVLESRDRQLHAFAPIPDSGTQKKRSQVLL
jgi:hypothetical protein